MENFRLFYNICEKEGIFEEEERKTSILKENKKKNGVRNIGQIKRREHITVLEKNKKLSFPTKDPANSRIKKMQVPMKGYISQYISQ